MLATIVLLLCSVASAFTLISSNPSQKGWSDPNVIIHINPTNCPASLDLAALVNDSAKIWNRVSTSQLKISSGDLTNNTAESSAPVIYCSTTFAIDSGASADRTLGVATLSLSGVNVGQGRIILNVQAGAAANITNFSLEQIRIVVAHEIGHLIGLGHSEYEYALMYYNIGQKEKLNLGQDDIDGVTYLYNRDELGNMKVLGCAQVESQTPFQGLMILVFMMLPLALLLRLKQSIRQRTLPT